MSSLRVRTQNKLLTVLGATKPSTNVAFDLAHADFEATVARLVTLDAALRSFAGSLKGFHSSAGAVLGAIDGVAYGGGGTASYQQDGKSLGSSEMQQFAGEARVACADVDLLVQQEATARLEQEVLLPVRGWLQHARALQNQSTAFQEQKDMYDHYTRKVTSLREAHEKRAGSGRTEKTKDTERMFRNEQKLAATMQEYTRRSDAVVRDLRAFVLARDAALAPLLRRVLRGRVLYAASIQAASNRMRALAEDGVEDDEGGVLGEFAALANGGSGSRTASIIAAAPAPTPCSIRKASFEDFVGESLPRVPSVDSAPFATTTNAKTAAMDDSWMSFASQPPPPQETQPPSPTTHAGYGFSESHYTPSLSVPMASTMATTTNATSKAWGDDDFPTPSYSTMPAMAATVNGSSNPWNDFPLASAPTAEPFPSGTWGVTMNNEAQLQQQQQFPMTDFRDMHLNALGGDSNPYR
ncbi:hypothetical protein BBJ28_00018046 [Nothophytophthora sp. Chile5]|nr:hypothetical protein BBJ28_00018046 [Nothophytophthora sp. Chile5]